MIPMTLGGVLDDALPGVRPAVDPGQPVARIRYDSRLVEPGDVFVAVEGTHVDGHDFVQQAVARGALVAVVRDSRLGDFPDGLPLLAVADTRMALADLAAARFGHPSRDLAVVGVTGTDGKTSTTFIIDHLFRTAGWPSGLVGTVLVRIGDAEEENLTRQTTPEAVEVQEYLARMRDARVTHAVLETSSHALALHRVRNVEYRAGVLTNFTSEHLDFHGTLEAYFEAKASLFDQVARGTVGGEHFQVLNADDATFDRLRRRNALPTLSFGISQPATVMATGLETGPWGSRFVLVTPSASEPVRLPLVGPFNVQNALAAVAVGLGLGMDLRTAARGLETVPGVPGRMERIDEGQPFTVVVDYAHTADSLSKVLQTLRPATTGRLIVVFGSAGDRDRQKRPEMGRVAAQQADYAIVTNEDPREEDEDRVLGEIAAGLDQAGAVRGRDYQVIADRRRAIEVAMRIAVRGDTVVLAGKGHEQSMIIGREKVPWDDRTEARRALRNR